MGCKPSRFATEEPSTDIDMQTIITTIDNLFNSEHAVPELHDFKRLCIQKITTEDRRASMISYLKILMKEENGTSFINIATAIMVKSQMIWQLNTTSLNFFRTLYEKDPAVFNQLIDQIQQLCHANTLYLQATHIDTVIASLRLQQALPENFPDILEDFLTKGKLPVKNIIRRLRTQHGPSLKKMAKQYTLIHHDIPHALEIKVRTMHVICDQLKLLVSDSNHDHFLRTIVSFMIEFHDFVQSDKGAFKSVELATAAHITAWLIEILDLGQEPKIQQILQFIADQVIVLGTTMVFSRQQTMDLSQLFFMIENAAIEANFTVAPVGTNEFLRVIKIITLAVGVCDKNPSALATIAKMQLSDEKTSVLPIIKQHYPKPHPLLFEKFFNHPRLSQHFTNPIIPTDILHQQFLITLVPHICMRAELSVNHKREAVCTFIEFINRMREIYSNPRLYLNFEAFFHQLFKDYGMSALVNHLFFNALEESSVFSRSQVGGLRFVVEKLESLVTLSMSEDGVPLIEPEALERNAVTLGAFHHFYEGLNLAHRSELIKELLLVVIFQPGTAYATREELSYEVQPVFSFKKQSPTLFKTPLTTIAELPEDEITCTYTLV